MPGRLTNRHNLTQLTYIELNHQVTPGRLTDPYKPQKVGFSTEFPLW
jgi:hypothetical protein